MQSPPAHTSGRGVGKSRASGPADPSPGRAGFTTACDFAGAVPRIGAGLAASGAAGNRSGDRACGRGATRYLYMSYRSPLKEATSAGPTRFESTVCRMTEG